MPSFSHSSFSSTCRSSASEQGEAVLKRKASSGQCSKLAVQLLALALLLHLLQHAGEQEEPTRMSCHVRPLACHVLVCCYTHWQHPNCCVSTD